MKDLKSNCRILVTTMMLTGMMMMNADTFGQAVCSTCNLSGCSNGALATGACSFAACENSNATGDGASALSGGQASGDNATALSQGEASGEGSTAGTNGTASGEKSTAFGLRSYATGAGSVVLGEGSYSDGVQSVAIGSSVRSTTGYIANHVIGQGVSPSNRLTNSISNSLSIGYNSTVSTVFIGPSSGSGTHGNVGIGNITLPASLLHVRDQIRVGYDSEDDGSIIFNNSTNSNTVSIQSGVTAPSSYSLTLPVAASSTNGYALVGTTAGVLSWADPDANAWKITGNSGTNTTDNFLGTIDPVDLIIRTYNTEKMRVMAGGNVGIGTSAPDGILHVLAPTGTNTDVVIDKNGTASGNLRFNTGTTTQVARIGINNTGGTTSNHLFYENLGNDLDQIFRVTVGNTLTEAMRIDGTTGWVGIGAPVPGAKLNVRDQIDSGREELARFNVADAPLDWLQIRNGTSNDDEFVPEIFGETVNHNDQALRLVASTDQDGVSDILPAMVFISRKKVPSSTDVLTNRALFEWRNNSSVKMHMKADGNLGIGTTAPSEKLHVAGMVRINTLPAGSGNRVGYNGSNQLIDWDASSVHFKNNIQDLEFDMAAFLSMRPVSYEWKEACGGSEDVGFVAQEVAEQFPPLATVRPKHTILEDGSILRDSLGLAIVDSTQMEPYSVKYGRLPVYLYLLAQRQESTIIELTERINQLQTMVESCCSQPQYRVGDEPVETMLERKGAFDEFVLLQNDPNPFADFTDIRVSLPETVRNASLLIVDIKGTVMLNVRLEDRSETVRIYSSDIGKGVFTYYLLSEGNVVASRKMVSSK